MTFVFRSRRRFRSAHAMVLAAVVLAACDGEGMTGPESLHATRVVLTTSAPAALASLGDTATLSARVLDQHGTPMSGAPVRWAVRTPGVVAQDADGTYRAIGNGRATIVATVDVGATGARPSGYWAAPVVDSLVIVVQQRAARLAIAAADTAFSALGGVRQLRVTVTDARGNAMIGGPPALVWRSADSRVVTVDDSGAVRAAGEGTARVTVESGELAGFATFTVRPHLPHTSCMVFARRRQTREACVTLDFIRRERESGR